MLWIVAVRKGGMLPVNAPAPLAALDLHRQFPSVSKDGQVENFHTHSPQVLPDTALPTPNPPTPHSGDILESSRATLYALYKAKEVQGLMVSSSSADDE